MGACTPSSVTRQMFGGLARSYHPMPLGSASARVPETYGKLRDSVSSVTAALPSGASAIRARPAATRPMVVFEVMMLPQLPLLKAGAPRQRPRQYDGMPDE